MRDYESEFEDRLEKVGSDARACAVYAYSGLAFHHVVAARFPLRHTIDAHAAFWNGMLGAQQTGAFVTLGRLFDNRPDTQSLDWLLRYGEQFPGIFSRTSLARRKVAVGLSEGDAATYVAEAFEPRNGGLAALRTALNDSRELYRTRVQPIRHRVYAHAGILSREERDALFAELPLQDYERLAVFPSLLHEALWQLYNNGREPAIASPPTAIADVLAAKPGPHTSTWQHIHAAADTEAFLLSLPVAEAER